MNTESTVLVVDDEPFNRDLLCRRLQRSGYSVESAEDGYQALSLIQNRVFNLVLLDNMMPGLSGIEVLKRLRCDHSPEQLPVIMVTAVNDSAKIAEALNLGANDYVTKPVDYAVALARIRSQLLRCAAEQALRVSEERYALAARGTNDGLWDWDLVAGTLYYSPRWKSMLGYQESEIDNSLDAWFSRVHPADSEQFLAALREHCQEHARGEMFEHEYRMLHNDGSYRWTRSRGVAIRDSQGKAVRIAGSQTDVTDRKVFDALTGLPNRLHFMESLSRALARAPVSLFAVLFLDIDHFKLINDSLGHLAGDQLLIALAQRIRSSVRSRDAVSPVRGDHVVARWSGDEFAILLEDLQEPANAARIAERILRSIAAPFKIQDREVFSTASIGIALSSVGYTAAEEIVRDADTAMYNAKALGKARCSVFDSAMRASVVERMELGNDLQRAVERAELILHYQPKVRLDSARICGFEALVRWKHPKRGLIPPLEFIPVAEETGLIVPIGLWVIREACLQMRKWHREFPQDPPLEISVNVSVRQFRQPDLVERIGEILAETCLTPSSLQLEITENILLENFRSALEILQKLKALNVGLKVDDFGTGYSCLQYLSQLPFDTVKIDRSFTGSMSGDNANAEIVRGILSMAHHLGMDVVAEGVEKSDQAAQLLSMGCDYGQGFYFCMPLAAEGVEEILGSETQGNYRENVLTDCWAGAMRNYCAAVGSGDRS